jgi:uncharacterized protein YrzB (UPF0473 family)
MRIPFKADDYFSNKVNSAFEYVQDAYLEGAKIHLETSEMPVMLGDGSISQSTTFDLSKIIAYFEKLIDSLDGWASSGISKSNTDDLHRLYFQISLHISKYHIYGYFGIQFHTLPYYTVNKRVIEIQKELSKIAEKAANIFSLLSEKGNTMVLHELRKLGYSELEFEELFTKLFEDQELVRALERKAQSLEEQLPEFEQMRMSKNQLYAELNNLLIEVYQISPVLIDYNRMMQGEEGLVTYFDVETFRNQKMTRGDPYVNTERVTKEHTNRISSELNKLANRLKNTSIT